MTARPRFPLAFAPAAALSVLSGTFYCLAFAGIDVTPLAFVTFVPLVLALHGQAPKRAALLGLLTGTTMNVGGFYWLQTMLQTFSGFPAPVCAFFTLVVCTYQGGRLALMGYLYAKARERTLSAPYAGLAFTGAFVASELAYPLLFPWYYAATVHNVAALTQVAELGGPIAVGVVLVLVNLALAEPLLAKLEGRPVGRTLLAAAGATLGFALLFAFVRIRSVDARAAESEPVHVGVVQGNMGLFQKREDPREGLRRHLSLSRELRDKGAELVVWSESSVTMPMPDTGYKAMMTRQVGRGLGVAAIVGGVIFQIDDATKHERWFNTALSFDDKGEILGRYDKQYLLAFGEHIPFSDTFPILNQWSPNSGKFSSGSSLDPLKLTIGGKEHLATTLICYEDILPSFANAAVRHANPELLVNITNDAWFGDTTEPWEHLALSKFRAIEHRRYFVRSTNSGVSAIVDPVGRVMAVSHTFRAEHIDAVVKWMRGTTVYELLGDGPWWLVTLGMAYAAFRPKRRAAAQPPSAAPATTA